MGWQVLTLTKPGSLSLKNGQCFFNMACGEEVYFPLDNLSVIMVESREVNFTSALLCALAESNIVLYICNEAHLPCGIFYPYMQYFAYSKVASLQQEWSVPFKNRIWQKLVQAKIANQAEVLEKNNLEGFIKLRAIACGVENGDIKNAEGFAAAQYWQFLFGKDFIRGNIDNINSALNYGYAILRGAVVRSAVSCGFIPCFGVHHSNNLNRFNLADDLIEPFRAFVDLIVYDLWKSNKLSEELSPAVKQELIKVLISNVRYGKENVSVLVACDYMANSLSKASLHKDFRIFDTPKLL